MRKSMELCFGTKTGKWSIDGTFLGILGGLKTRTDWAMGLSWGRGRKLGKDEVIGRCGTRIRNPTGRWDFFGGDENRMDVV